MDNFKKLIADRLSIGKTSLRKIRVELGQIEISLYPELSEQEAKALHEAKIILHLLEDEIDDA